MVFQEILEKERLWRVQVCCFCLKASLACLTRFALKDVFGKNPPKCLWRFLLDRASPVTSQPRRFPGTRCIDFRRPDPFIASFISLLSAHWDNQMSIKKSFKKYKKNKPNSPSERQRTMLLFVLSFPDTSRWRPFQSKHKLSDGFWCHIKAIKALDFRKAPTLSHHLRSAPGTKQSKRTLPELPAFVRCFLGSKEHQEHHQHRHEVFWAF